jgi:glycosyltransferase involved in cell wall biosynthesis
MGRLHEKKGLDMLINAAVKLDTLPRETRIVIAGPDESGYLTNLKNLPPNTPTRI